MRRLSLGTAVAIGLAVAAIMLTTPRPAEASIHEIIAAMCRAGGEEVAPPGQNKAGTNSFLRALQATGFITSIVETATAVTVSFDPTVPNSKFKDAGVGDVTIPDGIRPGVDLVLSPGIEPNLDFAAHAHCNNLK